MTVRKQRTSKIVWLDVLMVNIKRMMHVILVIHHVKHVQTQKNVIPAKTPTNSSMQKANVKCVMSNVQHAVEQQQHA